MKFLLRNHFDTAFESLKSNRLRTFLTVTGVTIGVTSIVAILSLTSGVTNIITHQVNDMGGNLAIVRPGTDTPKSIEDSINAMSHAATSTSSLTASDVDQLSELSETKDVVPLTTMQTQIKSDDSTITSEVLGTSEGLFTMSAISFHRGTFNEADSDIVTIGPQLSVNLFGTEESVGRLVKIKGATYRVGAVLNWQANPINFNGVDFDSVAIVTLQSINQLNPRAQIQQINIQATSSSTLDQLTDSVDSVLYAAHNNERDYQILTGDAIANPTGQLFTIIASVAATIAIIALFVGGVGIMNIMLVSVSERKHEVGIRKALGATNADIIWQFLTESIIIALVGGIIGLLLGLIGAFCISLFLSFNPVITWQIAAVALSISLIIGSIFGLYPAYRATRKNPIESLSQGD